MKKNVLALLAFISCISVFSQKYFEGMVEYKTSFESYKPEITEKGLRSRFGSVVRFYHKNGNYAREFFNEDSVILLKYIYKADSNMIYMIDAFKPDTVFFFSASRSNYKSFEIKKGDNDTILDCPCTSTIIYAMPHRLNVGIVPVEIQYFFCEELPINPDYYKGFFLWYDLVKEKQSVALRYSENKVDMFKFMYTATKIERMIIPDSTFEIDKKLILKEYNIEH